MLKISISTSRALFGLGVLATLGSVANANTSLSEEVTIKDDNITDHFNAMNSENIINYQKNCDNCGGSVKITFEGQNPFWKLYEGDDRERVHIKIDDATLEMTGVGSFINNYDFNTRSVSATDMRFQSMYGESYMDTHTFTLTGTTKPTGPIYTEKVEDASKIASILLVNGYEGFNGSLNIDDSDYEDGGNFTADKVLFEAYTPNNAANFRVYGKADIKNSLFVIERNEVENLSLGGGFTYINAGSFNADVTTSNEAKPFVRKALSELLPNTDTSTATSNQQYAFNPVDASEFAKYTLSVKKEGERELLIITSEITDKVTDLKALLELDKAILESEPDEDLGKFKDEITKRTKELEDKITALGNSAGTSGDFIAILAPKLKDNQLANGILGSLLGSTLSNDEKSIITLNLGKQLKSLTDSIESAAKSQTDTMGANSSANTAMNISNETSITARNVQYSNPYAFAKLLKDSKIAALDSDVEFDYYGINHYVNSVWVNAFGGANIIDGDNGSLYGISVGYDRQVTDSLLLGFYGTYSDSKIKNADLTNKADNFQLGLYANYRFAPTWELNARVYGQLSKTDLENSLTTGMVNADYTQRFFGISANVGKIFNPLEGFYLKPFAGVNYYYGYTPDYTERGPLAKNVRSQSNNSVSLEAGVEFRKYVNENSYLFVTPKIEQYVINNGDDYVASFIGSTSNFSIEGSDKKKTYGQMIIGGSVDLRDSLSLNAGIGAKHLLGGKIDGKDETYLSGNVGIKYKF